MCASCSRPGGCRRRRGGAGKTRPVRLVEPILPWALFASIPTLLAGVLGVVAIRRSRRELFLVAALAPFGLALFSVLALLATF